MIDPIHSLAFTIQANKGVYAILLGSGVSRSAQIPTGWEITIDLVHKLAALYGEKCEPDPEHWYLAKFGKDPNYSDLLDALAKTPTERQQLLRTYWEPSEREREEGAKQPTAAQRAIATLVAQGFVKVIITTNFDRLMESALVDAGVVPTVLSSPDQVQGALPLIHTQCCVFKVHGDYLDTRIRNTPNELAVYPAEFDRLLDRIFDEFGLVVCGWSADWDGALRSAMLRAPSRRFATYWAVRGEASDEARRLIDHRRAQVVSIQDADTFFQTVQRYVESLEEFSKPHPLSTEAAVASLKRYLSEPRYRIQLADLVDETVDRIVETTSGPAFTVQVQGGSAPTNASVTARVRGYEAACSTLLAMAPIGGSWAEEDHYFVWRRALERLLTVDTGHAYTVWRELQRYPGTLLLYALGLGAVEADRLRFLGRMFATTIHTEIREELPAVQLLPAACLARRVGDVARLLDGMERRYAALNDWVHDALRQYMKRLIPSDERYTFIFDKLEILMALCHAHHERRTQNGYWAPPGAFGYRHQNSSRILKEIEESISKLKGESPFVKSGIFGETPEVCLQGLEAFKEFVGKLQRRWF
ncbi:MAG: SIR2 family protein [Deltaproteobacteria bacterium]|nr:SIR2 family protein [Deltaproteobacteria bacterium]